MTHKYIFKFVLLIFLMGYSQIHAQFDFFEPKTTVGGYGELHYNYKEQSGDISKTLDFHRFVIFFGHSFSEKWAFKSEVELEHNFVSSGEGELLLEQAFIDYHYTDYLGFQAGVLLVSAGITNEYHEPTNFLSVERPSYSKYIIPTTWFGSGAGIYGRVAGFEYKFKVLEGLNSDNFRLKNGIRDGRQNGFKADASSMMYNFSADYIDVYGLRAGGSVVYNNAVGDSTNAPFTMIELHAKYVKNGFYLVGEFGNISYENINLKNSMGYYFDFGYDFSNLLDLEWKIIPFLRFSDYNTAASTMKGGNEEKAYRHEEWMIGLAVMPIDGVTLKADYSENKIELNSAVAKFFNLGVGYSF
ncbi:MAG: hypothetical protein GXO87_03520 [Chlorobi bacterium]|nr:hypothetical protein [Chlorobiota bacterium]